MKTYQQLLLALLLSASFTLTYAQESETFERHDNYYFSFGGGFSVLQDFPDDIYFAGSSNFQLGFMYERVFYKRFSVLVGLELEQVGYNFDGDLEFSSNNALRLIEAGPEKKYTGIQQQNITLPIQARLYFLDNNSYDSRNIFLQGGIRLAQSLDFIGIEGLGTTYFFRMDDENETIALGDYTNQTAIQLELMLGFKGQYFEWFDLLNASTLGFMYQTNPMFRAGSTAVYPLHFTWRFLF